MASTASGFIRGTALLASAVHDGARFLMDNTTTVISEGGSSDNNENNNNNDMVGSNQKDSSNGRNGDLFLIFSTAIISLVGFATLLCMFQLCRMFFCNKFARLNPNSPAMFVDEGRVMQLTSWQRRAVLEAIFSETSKAVTEEDIIERKQRRKDRRRLRKLQSSETMSGDDGIPSNVSFPIISTFDTITEGGYSESVDMCGNGQVEKSITLPPVIELAAPPLKRSLSWNDLSIHAGDVPLNIAALTKSPAAIDSCIPMTRSVSCVTADEFVAGTPGANSSVSLLLTPNAKVTATLPTTPSTVPTTPRATATVFRTPGSTKSQKGGRHQDGSDISDDDDDAGEQLQAVVKSSLSWSSPNPREEPKAELSSPAGKLFASKFDHNSVTPSVANITSRMVPSEDESDDDEDDDNNKSNNADGSDELALPALDMSLSPTPSDVKDRLPARAAAMVCMSAPLPPAGIPGPAIPLSNVDSYTTTSEYTWDDETEDCVCSICLSGYSKGDVMIASKHCSHLFHKECILEWLDKHDECPECRAHMVTESEMDKVAATIVASNNNSNNSNKRSRKRNQLSNLLVRSNTSGSSSANNNANNDSPDAQPAAATTVSSLRVSSVSHAIHRTPPASPRPWPSPGSLRVSSVSHPIRRTPPTSPLLQQRQSE